MLFSSIIFLFCFFPIVLCAYYVASPLIAGLFGENKKKAEITIKNLVLFFASLVFYAYGEKILVLLLIFSIFINYVFGYLISKKQESMPEKGNAGKLYLIMAIVVNLGILFVFKYLDFVISNLNDWFKLGISKTGIALPIGISFFTFQALSYVVDVYWKRAKAQKDPMKVGLYIALFPQLVAGPIVRYESIALQIQERSESRDLFSKGIVRFLTGLGKKVLLADFMAYFADRIFNAEASGSQLTVAMAWFGAVCYTLQIYFDFSGYSDMAIGLGKMFGFEFEENFNYPYVAKSITEFWHRWHISLSTWFRDYVFYPVLRSKLCGNIRNVMKKSGHKKLMKILPSMIAMFCVWSLTGIWHGANWTFLCWGLLFFVFQFAEEVTGYDKKWKLPGVLAHVYTMLVVLLSFVLFRAESLTQAVRYIGEMIGVRSSGIADATAWFYIKDNWVMFLIGILFVTPIGKKLEKTGLFHELCLGIILLVSIIYIMKGTYSPFIYFNF